MESLERKGCVFFLGRLWSVSRESISREREREKRMENMMAVLMAMMMISGAMASGLEGSPFMLVNKKASLSKLNSGAEQISVSIHLYNRGASTAYDVSLTDDSWPAERFSTVSGNTSTSWEKLDAGSSLSHSFVLETKEKGLFYGGPAVVKYRVAAALQEAYSTPIQPLDILAEKSPELKYEWAKVLAAKYGPLATVLFIVGLFVYVLVTPSSSQSKSSKKRR